MDNNTIMKIALQQSAYDCCCAPEDFLSTRSNVHVSAASDRARRYLELPHICNLVSYGTNIVVTGREDLLPEIARLIDRVSAIENCFETPGIYPLNRILERVGAQICFMADYFLPDIDAVFRYDQGCNGDLEIRMMEADEFQHCTFRSGKMPCARIENIWTGWGQELFIMESWWVWPAVQRIAIPCGRSVWMFCRNTEDRGLRRHSRTDLPERLLNAVLFRFTVPPGLM